MLHDIQQKNQKSCYLNYKQWLLVNELYQLLDLDFETLPCIFSVCSVNYADFVLSLRLSNCN